VTLRLRVHDRHARADLIMGAAMVVVAIGILACALWLHWAVQ
jgi:hypothetical protein